MDESKVSEQETETFTGNDLDNLASKFPNLTRKGSRKSRRSDHFYNLTAFNAEELIYEEELDERTAYEMRDEYHEKGYRVNLIERSNLTGIVERTPFVPPEYLSIKHGPAEPENNFVSRRQRVDAYQNSLTQKARDLHYQRENAKAQKEAIKKEPIRIYEKSSGNLCFSGTFDEAVAFIIYKQNTADWTSADWIMYLPKKLHELLTALGEAAE